MIKILHNLALLSVKNAIFFAEFFSGKILKNHNIGPRFLAEVRVRLQAKLSDASIPEKSLNVARICIDNVTILLQKSR
jgi:hypothetical protein